MSRLSSIWRRRSGVTLQAIVALLVACNYFAFRVELFPEEDEQNHPVRDCFARTAVFTVPTVTWESFDKDNAAKALTIRVWSGLGLVAVVPPPAALPAPAFVFPHPVRDKSPPALPAV